MSKLFQSTKTYSHSLGLSCCFRQWRAKHSHCQYLHGYAVEITLIFETPKLDERNWVVDFGGLKEVKQWLADTFDHKTLVARDDPRLTELLHLKAIGLADVLVVDDVGCEKFAEMIFDHVNIWLKKYNNLVGRSTDPKNYGSDELPAVILKEVEVKEHPGNSAKCIRG